MTQRISRKTVYYSIAILLRSLTHSLWHLTRSPRLASLSHKTQTTKKKPTRSNPTQTLQKPKREKKETAKRMQYWPFSGGKKKQKKTDCRLQGEKKKKKKKGNAPPTKEIGYLTK
jgi:hypothetical protein